jgi:predicted DNA binding protein
MAVNLKLSVRPDDLEIARVLGLSGDESVDLESQVPIGGGTVPFVRVRNVDPEAFETAIRRHPGVESIERFSREADEDLFAVDCRLEDDPFFEAVDAAGGYVLGAAGGPARWRFRLRFPARTALAEFDSELGDAGVPYEQLAVYHESPPSAQPLFGLTRPQREALVAAVEAGYFDIPRDVTTTELAEEFAISDQTFIERLRRPVSNLSEHTVMDEPVG